MEVEHPLLSQLIKMVCNWACSFKGPIFSRMSSTAAQEFWLLMEFHLLSDCFFLEGQKTILTQQCFAAPVSGASLLEPLI
ncbi:hypothetical protein A7P54_01855 [Acinetobacter sp. Ac_3412]|nr:hypothetical protein [Acinetobacter sp. Ac_3412]